MRYRKLSASGDYTFGQGLANFYVDQREAPAQAVLTRLRLLKGEWFADLTAGTDWATRVLGKYTISTYDPEIQQRIIGTRGVTALQEYQSQVDPQTRALRVSTRISTVYGETQIEESL